MFTEALSLWQRTLKQGAVWSTIVWSLLFTVLLIVLLIAVGAGALASAFYHPTLGLTSSVTPAIQPGAAFGALGAIYILLILAGPFLYAGMYGLFGQAVAGEAVSWRSFWTFAVKFYGRAWGAAFLTILWSFALSLVGVVLFLIMHVAGIVIAAVCLVLSIPWFIRMTGGLFVDRLRWGESFKRMFRGPHYGGLLGGTLLGLVAYALVFGLILLLIAHGALGVVVYGILALALSVAAPVWLFSLYRAAKAA